MTAMQRQTPVTAYFYGQGKYRIGAFKIHEIVMLTQVSLILGQHGIMVIIISSSYLGSRGHPVPSTCEADE